MVISFCSTTPVFQLSFASSSSRKPKKRRTLLIITKNVDILLDGMSISCNVEFFEDLSKGVQHDSQPFLHRHTVSISEDFCYFIVKTMSILQSKLPFPCMNVSTDLLPIPR